MKVCCPGSLTSDEQALRTLGRIGLSHSGAFATILEKKPRNYSGDTCLQTVQIRSCFVVFVCWTNSSDELIARAKSRSGNLHGQSPATSATQAGIRVVHQFTAPMGGDMIKRRQGLSFSRAACNLHFL